MIAMILPTRPGGDRQVGNWRAMKKNIGKLLFQQSAWQEVARSLPANTCLLFVDGQKNKQTSKLVRALARSFRKKGRQVIIW